jgi:hypothetical protein
MYAGRKGVGRERENEEEWKKRKETLLVPVLERLLSQDVWAVTPPAVSYPS